MTLEHLFLKVELFSSFKKNHVYIFISFCYCIPFASKENIKPYTSLFKNADFRNQSFIKTTVLSDSEIYSKSLLIKLKLQTDSRVLNVVTFIL